MTQTPLSPHDAKQYSPLSLAFLGDSVFDTLIREQLLRTANQPPAALHQKKVALVCAGFQATDMRELLPTLTEEEQAVFLRGRNAAPKHAHQAEYRYATGLEALFGYLYLTGAADRMQALMQQIRQTAAFQAVLTADAAENQQESVQTADKTHSVWYLFGAAVSAMFAGFAGSKRKKKSDEEL